jgi:hypothetical protein
MLQSSLTQLHAPEHQRQVQGDADIAHLVRQHRQRRRQAKTPTPGATAPRTSTPGVAQPAASHNLDTTWPAAMDRLVLVAPTAALGRAGWGLSAWLDRPLTHTLPEQPHPDTWPWSAQALSVAP